VVDGDDRYAAALQELAGRDPDAGGTADAGFLQEIMYSLENVSMGTRQLLYFSARKYASTYLDCAADDIPAAVAELAERFDAMEVGSLTCTDAEMPAAVELADNVLVADGPTTDQSMCYVIAGYISGFLENCLDEEYVVHETACMADGADGCSFSIQER